MSFRRRDGAERLAQSEDIEPGEKRDGEGGSRKEADKAEGQRNKEDALNELYECSRWDLEPERTKERDRHPERVGNLRPNREIPR